MNLRIRRRPGPAAPSPLAALPAVLSGLAEECAQCGWTVEPEIFFRDGRLLLDWSCPLCKMTWDYYARVAA